MSGYIVPLYKDEGLTGPWSAAQTATSKRTTSDVKYMAFLNVVGTPFNLQLSCACAKFYNPQVVLWCLQCM